MKILLFLALLAHSSFALEKRTSKSRDELNAAKTECVLAVLNSFAEKSFQKKITGHERDGCLITALIGTSTIIEYSTCRKAPMAEGIENAIWYYDVQITSNDPAVSKSPVYLFSDNKPNLELFGPYKVPSVKDPLGKVLLWKDQYLVRSTFDPAKKTTFRRPFTDKQRIRQYGDAYEASTVIEALEFDPNEFTKCIFDKI